jgi:hypothetical protein
VVTCQMDLVFLYWISDFFSNSTVSVYFTSPDAVIEDAMDADYILTLVILELDG